jgi:hypothetical protein
VTGNVSSPSWPGVFRPSAHERRGADGRNTPGHDGERQAYVSSYRENALASFGSCLLGSRHRTDRIARFATRTRNSAAQLPVQIDPGSPLARNQFDCGAAVRPGILLHGGSARATVTTEKNSASPNDARRPSLSRCGWKFSNSLQRKKEWPSPIRQLHRIFSSRVGRPTVGGELTGRRPMRTYALGQFPMAGQAASSRPSDFLRVKNSERTNERAIRIVPSPGRPILSPRFSSSHYDRWGGSTLQIVIAPSCHCEER